jgi:Txe/YoeB family toxin of Txe-Axe toxin-antitoxin module
MTTKFLQTIDSIKKDNFSVNETMQVLTSNISVYWSWGVSRKINYQNKALILKVSGHHHKGYVVITLDFNDTYNVHIVNTRGTILNEYNMVYFDNLVRVIDNRIESIPEYSY